MKTVLFATTALVASAGIAAADVTLSGAAELGIAGTDGENTSDPRFHTDIDATFTMTGETDTGLTFGADVDIDEGIADGGDAVDVDDEDGGAALFVSGAFGTLTMGDTDGALDWAMQEAVIGSALRSENENIGIDNDIFGLNRGFDGKLYDGQIARYEYAFENFSVAVSGEIDDRGEAESGDPILGIGARYAMDFGGVGMAFGAGVQTVSGLDEIDNRLSDSLEDAFDFGDNEEIEIDEAPTIWGLSADLTFAQGFRTILNYSDGGDLGTNYGVAVGYTANAFTVAATYGKTEDTPVGEADGYGLVANYDLGGGAELQAGWGSGEDFDGTEADQYSLGIAMAF